MRQRGTLGTKNNTNNFNTSNNLPLTSHTASGITRWTCWAEKPMNFFSPEPIILYLIPVSSETTFSTLFTVSFISNDIICVFNFYHPSVSVSQT